MDGTWTEEFQTRAAAILATAPCLHDCLGSGRVGGRIPASGVTGSDEEKAEVSEGQQC